MDAESHKKIFNGTIFTASAGAVFGVMNGFLNNKPLLRSTFVAGTNYGVAGCTFLYIREACLLYQRRSHRPTSRITRDHEELISSALAGGITGGVWFALLGGRRSIIPGFVVFTLLCGTGQHLYTSLRDYRRRLILGTSRGKTESQGSGRGTSDFPENVDKDKTGLLDWLAAKSWSPVRKISEEEYLRLKEDKLRAKGIDTSLINSSNELNDSDGKD
ncbi:835_t:CDS:2 [Acaulospora morrowiae]|uniref:835_t:CDS:1 n=1 Tax=Acaulospora morrowiae TaxID=94023 RepID=A0A9N9CR63_9GLOM|nr:835_t:CDS:2 [Acaulospora morrowiae]